MLFSAASYAIVLAALIEDIIDDDGDGSAVKGLFAVMLVGISLFQVYMWWLAITEMRLIKR